MKKTNFFLQFLNTFIVKLRICIAADTHIQFGGVVWRNLQTQRKGEAKVLLNKLCVCAKGLNPAWGEWVCEHVTNHDTRWVNWSLS